MTGIVRDARTGAPLEGAWVGWDAGSAHEWLRPWAGLRPTGTVTDAAGRFVLERVPDGETPPARLFAVARGFACAAVAPGLGGEVVVGLTPAAELWVDVTGAPDGGDRWPSLTAASPEARDLGAFFDRPSSCSAAGGRWRFLFENLPAGDYRLAVGGAPARPFAWRRASAGP